MAKTSAKYSGLDKLLKSQDLNENEQAILARALGTEKDSDDFESRLSELVGLAFQELTEWILGHQRFNSVTELDKNRILKLFLDVRKEPPTVESLVNEFGIPEGRAANMLARMRYGEARRLRTLTYEATSKKIATELPHAESIGGRKTIFLDRQTFDCVREANSEIMLDSASRKKGGKFEGAEQIEGSPDRWGSHCTASTKMWSHIATWLKCRAKEETT